MLIAPRPLSLRLVPAEWLADPLQVQQVLDQLATIAPGWVYAVVAVGVAIENFFPPIPADTFVLLGAFISTQGRVTGLGVFAATWTMNTAGAFLNYGIARRYGRSVLNTRMGRWVLRPRQLERLAALYNAHGSKIIFVSRFLPAFRALVPVFAGISRLSWWRMLLPVALASALWYGVLIFAGVEFGRNWETILQALKNVNSVLLAVAGLLAVFVAVLWWRTRRQHGGEHDGETI